MKPYKEMNIYDKASLIRDILDDPDLMLDIVINGEQFYPDSLAVEEDGEDGNWIALTCTSINHVITRIDHRTKETNNE